MSEVAEGVTEQTRGIIYNPHFWVIILIMAALTVFYNANHIDIATWLPWLGRVFNAEFIHDLHRSFFLIPLLYAGAVFRLRGASVCWLVFLAAVLPRALYFSPNPDSLMRTISFALIALLACILIALEENWRQGEKETFRKLEVVRQAYLSGTLKAQERERQRIAQELHDDTVQSLLVVANRSQALVAGDCGKIPAGAKKQAEEVRDAILNVTESVRRLSYDLRPSILDSMGLLPALRWLADRLTQEDNISTEVSVTGTEHRLSFEAEVIIFRIVQEAFNNIRRHSEATEAILTIDFSLGRLKIAVCDNGNGFHMLQGTDVIDADSRLGINGMRERAKLIGAAFDIQSEPGKGTMITLEARV